MGGVDWSGWGMGGVNWSTVRGIKKLPSTGVRTPVGQTVRTRTYAHA